MTSHGNPYTLTDSQKQANTLDEDPYAVILETNTEIRIGRGSAENDSPYAIHTVIMSNPAEKVTRKECSWFSWKRFCVGVLLCFVIASATTTGVVVTLYVRPQNNIGNEGVISEQRMDDRSTNTSSAPSGTSSSATPNAAIHSSTRSSTTSSTTPTTSSATTTRSTTSPTTTTTISPTTIPTTSPTTTMAPRPTTTMAPSPTTPSPTYDCSKPRVCHGCTSHEVNGRCKANGRLVDTVKFGLTEQCSKACYAEVRAPDQNYVHRGCVDSQGSKVEALVDPEKPGCFKIEKWPGAGVSTYCFCCDDLCNTQDMTKYGGIDV